MPWIEPYLSGNLDLISTAPYIYTALLELVQVAAAAQTPEVQVFPFELAQYEPGAYVLMSGIDNHRFEWELIGSFSQKEYYDVHGLATVFTGASQIDGTTATDTMMATYGLFQNTVMVPVMSNMTAPVFNNQGPVPGAVNQVYPGYAKYTGTPGIVDGAQAGWMGILEWSFSFVALITPA